MPPGIRQRLFSLAEDQFGFVTVEQARAVEISAEQLAQLARRGTLQRASYGVYRLVEFPASQLDPFMAAALWPRGVGGVISHESALDLYEVSDVSPSKLHLTVPRAHRVRRSAPSHYMVHRADLVDEEISVVEGIPVTTLFRTISDCLDAGLGRRLAEQAIEQGIAAGHVTRGKGEQLTMRLGEMGSISPPPRNG